MRALASQNERVWRISQKFVDTGEEMSVASPEDQKRKDDTWKKKKKRRDLIMEVESRMPVPYSCTLTSWPSIPQFITVSLTGPPGTVTNLPVRTTGSALTTWHFNYKD